MTKCKAKTPELTMITFEGLIDWAKAANTPLVNGVPWSFTYSGHPVTHENDDLYLVDGNQMRRDDVLVLSTRNEVWIYPVEEFTELYDVVDGA